MKFLKKKKYSILLNIFKYSFVGIFAVALVLPSFFLADSIKKADAGNPSLVVNNITSTEVELFASGILPNYGVIIEIEDVGTTPDYTNSFSTTTNVSGEAGASFEGLSPGGQYRSIIKSATTYVLIDEITFITVTIPVVKITNFNPTSGKVGDPVTISGENFIGVTNVLFNETKATPKTNNQNLITVNVPQGSTSGPIKIQTSLNGEFTTTNNFVVLPNTTTTTPPPNTGTSTTSGNTDYDQVEFKGLVPICNTEVDSENGGFKDPCDFNMVMALVNKVINFMLITLATPLFALIIIYVAWLYLSDMGSSENITKAKKIFKNVVIGYLIALAAWLIVKTILVGVGFDPRQAFLEF